MTISIEFSNYMAQWRAIPAMAQRERVALFAETEDAFFGLIFKWRHARRVQKDFVRSVNSPEARYALRKDLRPGETINSPHLIIDVALSMLFTAVESKKHGKSAEDIVGPMSGALVYLAHPKLEEVGKTWAEVAGVYFRLECDGDEVQGHPLIALRSGEELSWLPELPRLDVLQ